VNSNQAMTMERGDGIDIVAAIGVMWRYKYLIGSLSILFALAAVYVALTTREKFRAEVVVTQVHQDGLSENGGLASQLGGLASLAGLQVGGGANAQAQGVLTSRHLIEEFIKKQDLVQQLTAKSGKRATLWFAVKSFQETVIKIHEEELKGLTTISIDWFDPATAAKWANGFVALANELMRARAIEDAGRNVAFLNKQIAETREVEIQRSLSNLIESETKTLMLASGRQDYAFRVVDPAVPPEIRHSPRRTLLVLSGAALGFFVGAVFSLGHDAFRRRKLIQ
jgi:uncharacterized protein involved in exopolysaccharide biosynthesis